MRKIFESSGVLLVTAACLVACGSSDSSAAPASSAGSGGETAQGGASPQNGGASTQGGTTAQGGDSAAGGTAAGGAATVDTTVIASSLAGPQSFAIDATNAYWTGVNGGLYSVPLAGGAAKQIVTGKPVDVATDGTNLYWADGSKLMLGGLDGGGPQNLFGEIGTIGAGLAVHGGKLYYLGDPTLHPGLFSIDPANPGTATTVVAPTFTGGLYVSIVYTNDAGLYIATDGGDVVLQPYTAPTGGALTNAATLATFPPGADVGERHGFTDDGTNGYYFVRFTSASPVTSDLTSTANDGSGVKSLFTFNGVATEIQVAGSTFVFSTDAQIATSDAAGNQTPFATSDDANYRMLRLSSDQKTLYWFTGGVDAANLHGKSL